MSGVDAQALAQRRLGGGGECRQHGRRVGRAMGAGKTLGVQLDAVGAHLAHGTHRLRQRVHEQAHTNAQGLGLGNQRCQACRIVRETPAVVGGGL